jgi:dethiobiotin synthetase
MLLGHLRAAGCDALAMKPFCSGSRADARLLQRMQGGELTLAETNPFFYKPPLAPWVAAKLERGPRVSLRAATGEVLRLKKRCKMLLVEGSGGLLAPMGDNYAAAEIILRLRCDSIVVAPNCLGTINHTLLTVRHLQAIGAEAIKVVLMAGNRGDYSTRSNMDAIRELLPELTVISVPDLGEKASKMSNVKKNAKKMKKVLAQIIGGDTL